MIETGLGLFCLGVLFLIAMLKAYNLGYKAQKFPLAFVLGGLSIALFGWLIFFISFASILSYNQYLEGLTATVSSTANYTLITMVWPILNFLIIGIIFLTTLEVILLLGTRVTKRGRRE
jgi:hypothetical protein